MDTDLHPTGADPSPVTLHLRLPSCLFGSPLPLRHAGGDRWACEVTPEIGLRYFPPNNRPIVAGPKGEAELAPLPSLTIIPGDTLIVHLSLSTRARKAIGLPVVRGIGPYPNTP